MVQPLELEDFSGGLTDYYLGAPPNKAKRYDNLIIQKYDAAGKPLTRPGSEIYSEDAPQIPVGAQRISTIWNYRDVLHVQSAARLWWYNATVWSEILGPTGNYAFEAGNTDSVYTYSTWNNHTFITNSGRIYPKKVYIDATNTPKILEAGLPRLNTNAVTFDTPAAGTDNYFYVFIASNEYTTRDSTLFKDFGPESLSTNTPTGYVQLLNKSAIGPGVDKAKIDNIPVIVNSGGSNFDTTNIKIEIYRTISGGSSFFKVGEVSNGTTTFEDTVPDTVLLLAFPLYTTGGVVSNDRPPQCRLVHVFNDTGYYADLIEGSSTFRFRVRQSVPGDIDAVPESFFLDVDDNIEGMSSTKSNLVLFGESGPIYRVDGFFDELGRGGMVAERISDTAGCVSAQGIVQALDGLFWAGIDGIYWTDGFRVQRLNEDYDKTYATWVATAKTKIQGKYDARNSRIFWTVTDPGQADCNKVYVLDLNFGIRQKATFTTWSGGNNFAPTGIEFIKGDMIRADRRGYVFKHSDSLFTDPRVDTTTSYSNWAKAAIIYDWESVAFNFGSSFIRKYVTGVNITCESLTNLSLSIISSNDDDKNIKTLLPVRIRSDIVWGDPDIYWGDPNYTWGIDGLIIAKRKMPAQHLRCSYKSVRLTNAYVVIINSDTLGTADINASAKTVTLSNTTLYDWPTFAVDYFISFEGDNYTREYLITARTADVLTYSDINNQSITTVGSKWQIKGQPKNEVMSLISLCLHFVPLGNSQDGYRTSDSGEVSP